MRYFLLFTLPVLLSACNTLQEKPETPLQALTEQDSTAGHFAGGLDNYWYGGKAEINTYALDQIRYGEIHPGQINLIFVSEDFLTEKQVKNDNYTNPASTPVLKTNMIRRFTTGIYDYSIMTSTFTPTETGKQPHTLKVTTSLQDWCGQTFTQLNYTGGKKWDSQLRSYFEREADHNKVLAADFTEDEIFNRIRSGWKELPTGTFQIIPATGYLLMTHQPYTATKATVSLEDYTGERFTEDKLKSYTIEYPGIDRTVEIVFDAAAPYVIRGWTETYPSRGKKLTTVARLSHQVLAPYWAQNSVADKEKRTSLGLGL